MLDLGNLADIAKDAVDGGDFDWSAVTSLLGDNSQISEILEKLNLGSVSDLMDKLPADQMPQLTDMLKDGVQADEIVDFAKGFIK